MLAGNLNDAAVLEDQLTRDRGLVRERRRRSRRVC
jgi:hypothetical protein